MVVRDELNFSDQDIITELIKDAHRLGTIDVIFDLQRIEILSKRSSSSKYLFTKYAFEKSKQLCSNLRRFIVFSSCKDNVENIDDVLLREINLTKIFQEKSKEKFPGLLILLGPVTLGVEKCSTTENEKYIPFLSIPCIMGQMDKIFGLSAFIASIFYKISEISKESFDSKKVRIYWI